MRADRLVSLLLLLQARGHLTAREAAVELEVSERTARRDLEALSMAGIPVYSRQGYEGGWQLIGDARTDLSGLTAGEARALFLVAGPSSQATPAVKSALRKLVRALPETFRSEAERAAAALVVDQSGWGRPGVVARPDPPHLDALQGAIVEGRQVTLGYVARDGSATTRDAHPLGLASKGAAWYLVADTEAGLRTFRVDRVTSVEFTGRPAVRPADFDLAAAWRMVTEEVGRRRAPAQAQGTADPTLVPVLRWRFGTRISIGPAGDDGRIPIEVGSHNHHVLAAELAGFGAAIAIHSPDAVRTHLRQIAAELSAIYGGTPASAAGPATTAIPAVSISGADPPRPSPRPASTGPRQLG